MSAHRRLMGRKGTIALEVAPADVFIDAFIQRGSVAADLHQIWTQSGFGPQRHPPAQSTTDAFNSSEIKLNAGVTS